MESNQLYYLALSVGFALSIVALITVMVSPKTNSSQFYISNTEHLSPKMVKFVNLFGGDMLSLLPSTVQKNSIASKEVDEVFKASGNPWGVTKLEFFTLRVAYGLVYLIGGAIFSVSFIAMNPTGNSMIFLPIVGILAFLGWNKPISTYRKIAKERDVDFKKHFPEMLDYLTMIMGDGTYTFANALDVVIPYLPESAVKEEFKKVTDSINAGLTTEIALRGLANRVPSESLQAFVNAVNNANSLNTPMDDLMRTRAKKSREDLMNEIELVIQGLPTKTMLTIAPATIISMLTILMVPVIIALLSTI